MENLLKFIPENLIILIVATYVLGIFLKKIESIKDKYITMILMVFCIVFSILLNSINSRLNVNNLANAILQGILCWGVAVGVNQTAKQLVKDE